MLWLILAQINFFPPGNLDFKGPVDVWWAYGDSKAAYGYHPTNLQAWAIRERKRLVATNINGNSPTQIAARTATDLARFNGNVPTIVLISAGSNNIGASQAQHETDFGTILDAIHAAWPSTRVYVTRSWIQGSDADADTLATAIDTVVTARSSWAALGPDERICLKGSDDGATGTLDGVHPSATGCACLSNQWRGILGY